jgi:hypothetical protein
MGETAPAGVPEEFGFHARLEDLLFLAGRAEGPDDWGGDEGLGESTGRRSGQ